MMDVGRHPRINLLSYSEIESISGYVGNFHVRVRKKARYVDEKECTACGDCEPVCPVLVPDEFQMGLSSRRAIFRPFPQAVPSAYLVDIDHCLGNNPITCAKCVDHCDKDCIDFDEQDTFVDLDIGTIIVATGMDVYDPRPLDEYGYTRYEDVITSIEFERLISAGGPTEGHLVRPSDRRHPHRIAFIQCVGSRSPARGNPYCSNICCMNTIKDSLLLKDHYPDIVVSVFYMDIRAFGKGFEEMYRRSRDVGVRYIRGLPGEVELNGDGTFTLTVENTTANRIEQHEADMVILSVGGIPRQESEPVRQLLALSRSPDGFFLEAHPKLRPVDAPSRGVYFAGCVEAPKDVKDTVTQASAAAARAQILLNQDHITLEAITAFVNPEKCTACGLCAKVCPFSAIVWEKKQLARVIEAACAGCGTCAAECRFGAIEMRHFSDSAIQSQVEAILEERPEEVVVGFACNWCSYAGADLAGTSRLQYPPSARLVRTMCSGRVSPQFVWQAFQLGAPVVLVSGCHYADCHYIDANRQTVRRVDVLWDALEKAGIRPERLQLEWVSAAEGQKWARVMQDMETLRAAVTAEEIARTVEILSEKKVPNVKIWKGEGGRLTASFHCMRCGHDWEQEYDPFRDERMCPSCRSNSVRWVK